MTDPIVLEITDAEENALTATPDRYLAANADCHLGREIEGVEMAGFKAFFAGPASAILAEQLEPEAFESGQLLAHRLCYAQGVKAGLLDEAEDPDNPYPQFSAAWEAWADGYNDETAGALG